MKKILCLLLSLLMLPCALAELDPDDRLLSPDELLYTELSADELPDGDVTENQLHRLEDAHAARLLDSILPYLTEKGYIRDTPRSAFLDYEGYLWTECTASFVDLYTMVNTLPADELPHFTAHITPDCDPDAQRTCNYFAMYFMGAETLFSPCTKCFPHGWIYDYLVSYGFEELNRLRITPWFEPQPGVLAQPREIIAIFDRQTDRCLSIAVEYNGQGFTILWQDPDFVIAGVQPSCAMCDKDAGWYVEGLWHCRACGNLFLVEEE